MFSPLIPPGPAANPLRRRKRQRLARLQIPADALPGALALTHRRGGKPSCHCADGQGHPLWSLTFRVQGKKRVEQIPLSWVEEVRPRVEQSRRFKEALAELFVWNAELFLLERKPPSPKNQLPRADH